VASALLSEAQAAKLAGAFELCRRLGAHRDAQSRLTTAGAIWNWVRPSLGGLRREVFRALCIDARSRLLRDVKVAECGENRPRWTASPDVVRPAAPYRA